MVTAGYSWFKSMLFHIIFCQFHLPGITLLEKSLVLLLKDDSSKLLADIVSLAYVEAADHCQTLNVL